MNINRIALLLLVLLTIKVSFAGEDDLTLDPNDIPLPADSINNDLVPSTPNSNPTNINPNTDKVPEVPTSPVVVPNVIPKDSEETKDISSDPASSLITEEKKSETLSIPSTSSKALTDPPSISNFKSLDKPTFKSVDKVKTQTPVIVNLESETPENLSVKTEVPYGSEEPNFKLEKNFNKIYQEYNKQETSIEDWEKVVGNRKSEIYNIQRGDTLWDLSKTLFGDPYYWPKIWSLNQNSIYNPHEINPSTTLHFYPGTASEIPTLAVTSKNKETGKSEGDAEQGAQSKDASAEIKKEEPPRDIYIGGRGKIPSSFRPYSSFYRKEPVIKFKDQTVKNLNVRIPFDFLLMENEFPGVGNVSETEMGMNSASENQIVFVNLEEESQGIYTVIHEPKKVLISEEKYIFLYEVEGEIEVVEKVNSETNTYRAMVRQTRSLVQKNSRLIPGRMKIFNTIDVEESRGATGKIIANLVDDHLVSNNTFVVINKGRNDGYVPGKKFPIYANNSVRELKSQILENPRYVGSLFVVESTENFSSAYVAKVLDRVYINDYVGSRNLEGLVRSSTPDEVKTVQDEVQ